MNRLVETVASLFQGSAKDMLDRTRQEADTQLAASKVQSQIELAAKLVKLQQELGSGTPAEAQAKIDKLLGEVMPGTASGS